MRSIRCVAAAACVAVLATSVSIVRELGAQSTEITPFVGLLLPVSNLVDENIGGEDVTLKHKTGITGGLRLTHWTSGRLGFQGALAYSKSDVVITDTGDEFNFGGRVVTFSGKVLYDLSQSESNVGIHIGAGPAVIARGGELYDEGEFEGTIDVGLVLGAGVRLPIGQRLKLSLELEDFISSVVLSEGGVDSQSQLQNDLMLSFGVSIPLGASR